MVHAYLNSGDFLMATRVVYHEKPFMRKLSKTVEVKLEQSGAIVKDRAKALCPVETGKLRNSIQSILDTGQKEVGPKDVRVGSGLSYAPFVEFGTRYKAPQSFLRKALTQARAEIRRIFSRK